MSRKRNLYKSFPHLCAGIHLDLDCPPVLDGEIVVLDSEGQPQFYDLLRRRGEQVFYAFDVLWIDGEDVRSRPPIERKRLLRSIVPEQTSATLYARHIERTGVELYRLACEQGLEGIVAKVKEGRCLWRGMVQD